MFEANRENAPTIQLDINSNGLPMALPPSSSQYVLPQPSHFIPAWNRQTVTTNCTTGPQILVSPKARLR